MRRAWIVGGPRDGQRVGFDADSLPSTITLDGTAYKLTGSRQFRSYVATSWQRGRAFTAERKRELLEHVAAGETISNACKLAGISSAAVYRHRRLDPDFRAALIAARNGVPWSQPIGDVLETVLTVPEVAQWHRTFTRIAFVGGVADGQVYPAGPPPLLEAGGEVYRLTIEENGYIRYVADSAHETLSDLAVRRWERERDEDEDCGL